MDGDCVLAQMKSLLPLSERSAKLAPTAERCPRINTTRRDASLTAAFSAQPYHASLLGRHVLLGHLLHAGTFPDAEGFRYSRPYTHFRAIMDEPAPKRRRTASPREGDTPLSPLKQPPRRLSLASRSLGGRASSPLKDAPRRPSVSPTKAVFDSASSPLKRPPRRPSFASPTKASLARNYPSLLPTRLSPSESGPPRPPSRADILARGKQAREYILGDKDTQDQSRREHINEEGGQQTNPGAEQPRIPSPQIVTPRARRTVGTWARNGASYASGEEEEEEEELPTSPSQRTMHKLDTPRRGILFSSPNKPPRRSKDLFQQPDARGSAPAMLEDHVEALSENLTKGRHAQGMTEAPKESPDPELEKKIREKERLKRELEELESDVVQCTEVIATIQEQPATHVMQPAEREDLIAFINKISSTEADEELSPTVSSLLCSFLPFSARIVPPPTSQQPRRMPVANHQPLELKDPMPYLEMFTAFKLSTQLSLPQERVPSSPNHVCQKHVIDITGPQKLLTASISIIIDASTNTIVDLNILRLSSWAERELGSFIHARAKEKDLGNICWAIGSYWEIAKRRAEYWFKCEMSFGHLMADKRRDNATNVSRQSPPMGVARKDYYRHLGRDVLVLKDEHVMLKTRWQIGFDWSGEAESTVVVEPAVPRVCKSISRAFSPKRC